MPLSLPVTAYRPHGVMATAVQSCPSLMTALQIQGGCRSQTLRVPSVLPDTACRPSGVTATDATPLV
eukprot:CAMPEP_0202914636 /NCGR_PEP_ID=MMETSP1392-20130828/63590_1 /ASSEMBLY_ACC=CAM_ASM_000868 /TAXON_ID=225041 /ORGANISM="Chlamydomonas chlamydogama, Strain SAG 11-48b" /LENGTH=66 /DNA_ID=CAMNT_0049606349 /DNA_START=130 /DNA_END=330 /DNA_ORIENTATION=+